MVCFGWEVNETLDSFISPHVPAGSKFTVYVIGVFANTTVVVVVVYGSPSPSVSASGSQQHLTQVRMLFDET